MIRKATCEIEHNKISVKLREASGAFSVGYSREERGDVEFPWDCEDSGFQKSENGASSRREPLGQE